MLLAAAGGVYVGARWHSSVGPMLGMKAADQAQESGERGAKKGTKQLWTCGMHPQVIQDKPGDCPICHMKLTPLNVDNAAMPSDGASHDHSAMPSGGGSASMAHNGQPQADRKVKYWWDPMLSPPYISDKPGKSPMGMDLIPVYEDERAGGGPGGGGGAVTIDPAVVQNMGVRVAMVTAGPLARSVRLVGYLDEAQPNLLDINLRVSGWIRRLHANIEGQHVEAGDPLFDLYSPELQVAVEELITARRARAGASTDSGERGGVAAALYDAAANKLELFGLDPRQIEALSKLDKAPAVITFTSPVTGDITEKPVVEGAAVKMGDRVLRIVDHSTLWLDARVFEKDLPFVSIGQHATATLTSRPDGPIDGEVIFVDPRVDPMTRTSLVRMALPNPSLALKPGMYATVRLESQVADRAVMVPREAIIDTGESQVAFVAEGVGRFQPRRVKMGLAGSDGLVQVLEGLAPGEAVVTSGQFLIDSESRLREAIQKFLSQQVSVGTGQGASTASSPVAASVEVSPDQQQKIDTVVSEYLKLSRVLGAVQDKVTPVDMAPLVSAAHALHGALSATRNEPLAVGVAKAAEAMKGHPLDHQRQLFSALGERVIALVDVMPPTAAVAKDLYVMNCPMAPGGAKGDWLQTSPDVANPFFATSMKECGSSVRTINTREVPR
ncbi:MAG: efflux RND transporter periplasmic adaptor subunit [Phycisphaerales bacterium]